MTGRLRGDSELHFALFYDATVSHFNTFNLRIAAVVRQVTGSRHGNRSHFGQESAQPPRER